MAARLTLIHPNGDKQKAKVVLATKQERRTLDLVINQTYKYDPWNLETAHIHFMATTVCMDIEYDETLIENCNFRTFVI
jgi:hypothetical protein